MSEAKTALAMAENHLEEVKASPLPAGFEDHRKAVMRAERDVQTAQTTHDALAAEHEKIADSHSLAAALRNSTADFARERGVLPAELEW